MLVGFESARIGVMTEGTEKFTSANIFTIDKSSGRTIGANIQGLNSTPTTLWGSNTPKQIRGVGTGNVTLTLAAEDVPEEVIGAITGAVKDANGIWTIGRDTKPPFSAIEIVSSDGNNPVYLALLKGTFGFPDANPQTNQQNQTIQTDSLTFTGTSRDSDYRVFAKGFESDPSFQKAAWDAFVFPFNYAAVTSIAVAPTTVSLAVGGTQQLTPTILPVDANQAVTYSTSDASKATVTGNGLVTGVAIGSATITVKSNEDPSKTATVSVTVA
ncbi:major tail protein [Sporolactobacillus putidus]|uniref:BIG2 domain-containing protein n=1 Tax=Sporolactobacillus putidus TaxID=492735 RepID=A0A917S5C9_9BACL|nr:major tail protein [Sporolactobacillus putidus]GGL55914.1 hypothetical protein GCM10007968_20030 [Sporolactobacillus putidus]